MKKYLSFLIIGLSFTSIQAQEVSDALRYAQDNLSGTARFRAMGGAFGALGGDMSSINVNPAGSVIFANNQVAITLSSLNTKNKSNYFGTRTEATDNTFDLNQVGGAWVFNNRDENSKWKKFSVGVNYENANNFSNSVYSQGYNPTNSVADYFTSYANGIPLATITDNAFQHLNYREQQAYLGYEGYIINPEAGDQYTSAVGGAGNFYQENFISTTGYNGKLSFNTAVAYDNTFYFGLNLNAHFTDFNRTTSFYEDYLDSPGNDPTTGVQGVRFDNELYTYGSGFSFQLGAIAKVSNEFRVGLAYESPTWYRLNEELRQTLIVECPDCGTNDNIFYADPDMIMIYPTYRLQTPGKLTGSLAYVFGTNGLLSVDYIRKDYSSTKFSPSEDYIDTNNQMANLLATTNEFRVGGEYRIKAWSLRGGYRFEQSPYEDGTTIGDLTGYSGGLGYNFGHIKLDLAYTYAKRDYQQAFFSQGLTDTATINSRNDNVSLTLLFEL